MLNVQRRIQMVRELETEGIKDKKVLEAMERIPRHEFLPRDMENEAYLDIPLPIGYEQTISQPYTVAFMLEELELEAGNKVLEIGTATGYNACLIAEIVGKKGKVYTIEIIPELAKLAEKNIEKMGMKNIKVVKGDGSQGYGKARPYDRIILTAGAPEIPRPLVKQLKIGGVFIGPIGSMYSQNMVKLKKTREGITQEEMGSFMFVPLRGKYGRQAKDI